MKSKISIGYLSSLAAASVVCAAGNLAVRRHDWIIEARLEIGWQSLCKKLQTGELDAAVVPPVYPFAEAVSTGKPPEANLCLAMGFGGRQVVVSESLAAAIETGDCPRSIRFSTSGPLTCDAYYLGRWLTDIGHSDWRRALVPLPVAVTQYADFLSAGLIDAFVCEEPLATWAEGKGFGRIIPKAAILETEEVASVLVIRDEWLALNGSRYTELQQQLLAHARWAAEARNATRVGEILKQDGWDLSVTEIAQLFMRTRPDGKRCFSTVRGPTNDIALNTHDARQAWEAFAYSFPSKGEAGGLPEQVWKSFKSYGMGPPMAS